MPTASTDRVDGSTISGVSSTSDLTRMLVPAGRGNGVGTGISSGTTKNLSSKNPSLVRFEELSTTLKSASRGCASPRGVAAESDRKLTVIWSDPGGPPKSSRVLGRLSAHAA
jgi:hypothetical protein